MDGISAIIGMQMGKQCFTNLFQRQVCSKNGHRLSLLVVDWRHVRDQRCDGVGGIEERL